MKVLLREMQELRRRDKMPDNPDETVVFEKLDNNIIRLIRTAITLQSKEDLIKQRDFYKKELVVLQTLLDETNAKIALLDSKIGE